MDKELREKQIKERIALVMARRQRQWARKARERLQAIFGFACVKCGAGPKKRKPLEFDCIEPRGHEHHAKEWSARISFYRQQLREDNLQLLCKSCHIEKTKAEREIYCPF